ncbi:MAG: hypothetical protein CM15mP103_00840 [Gammaproteobacteria bacterium]|nr:MAG: hypothetical protein CM15mP103_00840 [Gammaproteobacteria bacterium]
MVFPEGWLYPRPAVAGSPGRSRQMAGTAKLYWAPFCHARFPFSPKKTPSPKRVPALFFGAGNLPQLRGACRCSTKRWAPGPLSRAPIFFGDLRLTARLTPGLPTIKEKKREKITPGAIFFPANWRTSATRTTHFRFLPRRPGAFKIRGGRGHQYPRGSAPNYVLEGT